MRRLVLFARSFGVVVIPVEKRRNIDAQLVVADPANIIEQIVVGSEAETGAAVKTVTFIRAFVSVAGHHVELGTDAPADGKN